MNLSYAFALSISTLISAAVAFITWRRRSAPGSSGLTLVMLATAVWTGTYAIRWLVVEQSAQYFWLDATYLGVVGSTYFMVIFALQSTHRAHLLTRRNLFLLAVEPLLTLILLWTDNLHGLFYAGIRTTGTILNGGPWFWINVIYSYSINLVVVIFFIREYMRASHLYRRQTGTILIGLLLPWIGNIISFSKILPFTNLDITPFVFILTGLVFAYGLIRYGLMDIVPVAHSRLIESLPDGMLVLDAQRRILEINPAARGMIGVSLDAIGKPVETALAHWPGLKDTYRATTETQTEMRISENLPRDIEVRVMPLFDMHQNPSGSLILLRDITERKQMEEKLKQLSIHDALTGLYNRAYFEDVLARLERGGRQFPISFIMADVDDLKKVNDQQGHAAGDAVLKRTAQVLNAAFRAEDVITRIGGDEFVVILPNTKAADAELAIVRVRRLLQEYAGQSAEPLSISLGMSTAEVTTPLTDAFKKADDDMYREKRAHHGK